MRTKHVAALRAVPAKAIICGEEIAGGGLHRIRAPCFGKVKSNRIASKHILLQPHLHG
jgi:hypothetical protein